MRAPRSGRSRRPGRGRARSRSPCRKTTRPSTTTWVTSSATAAKTAVCSSAPVPAVRTWSVSIVTRSARLADRDRAGVVPAEASRAAVPAVQQLGGRPVAALLRGEPLVELDGAHLLEQVDHGVAVGAEREPRAGVVERAARARCRRRGRARWWGRSRRTPRASPISRMSSSVRWVACTSVLRSVEVAGLGEDLGRGEAVRREALLVLGDLLGEVDVQRRRPSRVRIWSRGTARTEW